MPLDDVSEPLLVVQMMTFRLDSMYLDLTTMIERHYSARSVAELLDIKPDTIRKMIQRRTIPTTRIGGKLIRIPESAITSIMEYLPSISEITDSLLGPD
jgi:excisionase family DNA binding protein